MRRQILVLLFAAMALVGCDRSSPPLERPGKPALWQIENREGDPVGWLFGTIHALPDGVVWETPRLDQVVNRAGGLVVEVRDLDPASLARAFEGMARDECPCSPLVSRLAPEERAALPAAMASAKVPSGRLDGFETWAAALALARSTDGIDPANGTDKMLMERFSDRPIVELEGASGQLSIFDDLPEAAQRAMLGEVVRGRSTQRDAERLARSWLDGDVGVLEDETRKGLAVHPALERDLLTKRNHDWVDQITGLLEAKTLPLVAVGLGHIPGPDGVSAGLEAKGFTVRRIQ